MSVQRISRNGSRTWQLTDVPTDKDHATMIPEFSPDGRLLEWTERTKSPKFLSPNRFAGFWVIKVADFNVSQDGTPSLSDIRAVSPPGDAMNETGGFSADSSSLVFTSDFENHNFWHNQIYRLDLKSGAIARLTRGDSYNEHPRYTPDGQVLWMSNAGNPSHGTDWWTMNPTGQIRSASATSTPATPTRLGTNRCMRPSCRPPIGAPTTATSTAMSRPTC